MDSTIDESRFQLDPWRQSSITSSQLGKHPDMNAPRKPAGAWRVVAASSTGTAHLKSGAPCQDAHTVSLLNPSTVVLIAADGSGSASRSDIGSQLATQRILEGIRGFLRLTPDVSTITRTIAQGWLKEVAARLVWQAKTDGQPLKNYSCTLLVAIVSSTHACFFQVGDGAMLIRQAPGDWQTVFWPQHGEFANETFYITHPESIRTCEFVCRAAVIDEIAVFTDGIETLALNAQKRAPVSALMELFFNPVRDLTSAGHSKQGSQELEHFLASEEILCKYSDDDKTLLMASRLGIGPRQVDKPDHRASPIHSYMDTNHDREVFSAHDHRSASPHTPFTHQQIPAAAQSKLLADICPKKSENMPTHVINHKRQQAAPKGIDWRYVLLWKLSLIVLVLALVVILTLH